jgi:hypothetical protein
MSCKEVKSDKVSEKHTLVRIKNNKNNIYENVKNSKVTPKTHQTSIEKK